MFNKYVVTTVRMLFGFNYLINGLNPFVHFFELPKPTPAAGAFAGALLDTGYLLLLAKAVEIVAGSMLLVNRFVPLALVLIFPVSLNIFLFDLILDARFAWLGILVLALNVYLCFAYLEKYRPMLASK